MSGKDLPLLHALPQQDGLLQPHHPQDTFLQVFFCNFIYSS